MRLSEEERRRIDQRIAAFESHTGAQVVTAVVDRCSHYPEIPWKAFALGASLGALARVGLDMLHPEWLTSRAALIDAVVILGCGALLGLASVLLRSLGRLFLHGAHAEDEVIAHAWSLFLRHEVFVTPERNGALILVSRFERRVAIVMDTALRARVEHTELSAIIARMTPLLARGDACEALCEAVTHVEALLITKGFVARGGEANRLSDQVIEEDRHA
jgi:putative membrane protein